VVAGAGCITSCTLEIKTSNFLQKISEKASGFNQRMNSYFSAYFLSRKIAKVSEGRKAVGFSPRIAPSRRVFVTLRKAESLDLYIEDKCYPSAFLVSQKFAYQRKRLFSSPAINAKNEETTSFLHKNQIVV